jgi:hypothetical protein
MNLQGWFDTRPRSAPTSPIPPRPSNVVAAAFADDGTAELRIIRRQDGFLSFEIVARTNFEDAGGSSHHIWYVFHPEAALITDSFNRALESAMLDAKGRKLSLGPIVTLDGSK